MGREVKCSQPAVCTKVSLKCLFSKRMEASRVGIRREPGVVERSSGVKCPMDFVSH